MDNNHLVTDLMESFESFQNERVLNRLKLNYKGENVILYLLTELGGKSTPGKLCERVDFTAARLSAIIKSLESKGYVERIRNENDKRSTIVALTPTGAEHFRLLKTDIIRNSLTIIEKLGEEDVRELLRIINRLSVIANSMEDM